MKKIQTFIIIFIFLCFAQCKKQDDLYSVQNKIGTQISDIISFQNLSSLQIDADGASLCTVKVKINPETDSNARAVSFSISGGKFTTNDTTHSVIANTQGYASISFYDLKEETVDVKASIESYSIDTIVSFVPALPDDFLLAADHYVADITDSINFTAALIRNPGRGLVTDPIKISYTIVPLDTTVNLIYPEYSYSVNQQATIDAKNPFSVAGNFTVIAKTKLASGDSLTRSISIRIKN